jgi:hypothetical protein
MSPSRLAIFATNGSLLTDETAELAKKELDQGVPFGTYLTSDSIKKARKEKKGSLWERIKSYFW